MSKEKKNGRFAAKATPLQKALTAVGLVLCVVFGFTLVCNLTIIIKGALYPEKPPSVLGITPMVVLSGSMSGDAQDHIEVGDLILVGKAEEEALAVGDIIAFMSGETVITHRIIEIRAAENGALQFFTKGDANNTPDSSPVTADNLVGIYRWRIPKVGELAVFLQTPIGMLLCIGVPMLGFTVYDIIVRRQAAEKERKRRLEVEADLKRLHALMGQKKHK